VKYARQALAERTQAKRSTQISRTKPKARNGRIGDLAERSQISDGSDSGLAERTHRR